MGKLDAIVAQQVWSPFKNEFLKDPVLSSMLVLVRHGESEVNPINLERRFLCGQFDTPLTERGREQAVQAGKRLASLSDLRIDAAISSTLHRARETLALIQPALPVDCWYFPPSSELNERCLGEFEGHWESDIFDRFPVYRDDPKFNRFANDFVQKAPGGESLRDVTDRMTRQILQLWDDIEGDWLAVTHGCAIRCVLGRLLHWSDERVIDTWIPNAVPILVRRIDRERFELVDLPELGDD